MKKDCYNIMFKDTKLLVFGEYIPGEDEITYYGSGDGYSGSSSSFEILKVCVEDSYVDIWELFSRADLEKIEELIIEKIEE